jgi:hypothetical protein
MKTRSQPGAILVYARRTASRRRRLARFRSCAFPRRFPATKPHLVRPTRFLAAFNEQTGCAHVLPSRRTRPNCSGRRKRWLRRIEAPGAEKRKTRTGWSSTIPCRCYVDIPPTSLFSASAPHLISGGRARHADAHCSPTASSDLCFGAPSTLVAHLLWPYEPKSHACDGAVFSLDSRFGSSVLPFQHLFLVDTASKLNEHTKSVELAPRPIRSLRERHRTKTCCDLGVIIRSWHNHCQI